MKHLKKFFELVDYDVSDEIYNEEEYDGYVYLYSSKPLKKEDISDERIYLYNRADTSDPSGEYIYQIKIKNPLYKKNLDFFGFSLDEFEFTENPIINNNKKEKPQKNTNKYSGYFYEHSITSEWLVKIKLEDIINFRRIGGFAKYDKHNPKSLDIKLSEKTDSWLYNYIGEGSLLLKNLSDDIIEELKPFKPKKSIKIYKGIEEVQIKYFSEKLPPYKKGEIMKSDFTISTSWTTNILVARRFVDEYPSSTPFVISMIAEPDDILVDVQMLPNRYYHTNQREIIILPGKYEYKLVWSN